MAIDPSKIVISKNKRYAPGEIIIKIKLYKKARIKIIPNSSLIKISNRSKRPSLIMHAAILMRKALGNNCGLFIDVDNSSEIIHAGLGSSSGLIAVVANAINELFGKPLNADILASYLAQNHGEEIYGDEHNLVPVQCIGGSALGGQHEGALQIIAGASKVIASANIDPGYKVIIGIPMDFQELDAEVLFKKEVKNFPKFIKCGLKFGPAITYRLVHEAMPALVSNDIIPIGNLIYDYRFKMGSINNCSYTYRGLNKIARSISIIKSSGLADILALSSVGPAFFAITKKSKDCIRIFEKNNLRVHITDVENGRYKIIWRSKK